MSTLSFEPNAIVRGFQLTIVGSKLDLIPRPVAIPVVQISHVSRLSRFTQCPVFSLPEMSFQMLFGD